MVDDVPEETLGAMGLLGTLLVPDPDMLPEGTELVSGAELVMGAELLVIGFEDDGFDEDDALLPQQAEKKTILNARQRTSANNFLGKIQTSFRPCKLPADAHAIAIHKGLL
ncbi:MAG: hypothetical protein RR937_04080 [Ruthenibacterium sp.]